MFDNLRNRRRFKRELAQADEREIVCATLRDGVPTYFRMPADAEDMEIRDRAFEIREGRGMNQIERKLLDIAETRALGKRDIA